MISEPSSVTTLTVTSTFSNFLASISSIATVTFVVTTYNRTVSPSTFAAMYFKPAGTTRLWTNSPFSNTPSISPKFVETVTGRFTVIGLDKVPFAFPSVYVLMLTVNCTVSPSLISEAFAAVKTAHLFNIGLYPLPPAKSLGLSLVPHQLSFNVIAGVAVSDLYP